MLGRLSPGEENICPSQDLSLHPSTHSSPGKAFCMAAAACHVTATTMFLVPFMFYACLWPESSINYAWMSPPVLCFDFCRQPCKICLCFTQSNQVWDQWRMNACSLFCPESMRSLSSDIFDDGSEKDEWGAEAAATEPSEERREGAACLLQVALNGTVRQPPQPAPCPGSCFSCSFPPYGPGPPRRREGQVMSEPERCCARPSFLFSR